MTDIELVDKVSVELIQASASDDMVAMAAWVSNDADAAERLGDKAKVQGLINFLYRNRHMSPFEHGVFIFKVDVPLFVAREWHRHRTQSYNEVSGRYTVMKPRFYTGEKARVQKGKMGNYYFEDADDETTAFYRQSNYVYSKTVWREYQRRIDMGISKEQAREILPVNLMTQFYVTVNPRNLMQFLSLRNDKHALKEIRDAAVAMEEIFAEVMPVTARAYRKYQKRERWAAEQEEHLWDDENPKHASKRALRSGGQINTFKNPQFYEVNVMVPPANSGKDIVNAVQESMKRRDRRRT